MDNAANTGKLDIAELTKKAEEIYPMPLGACPFVKRKYSWLRERWVLEQIKLLQK
jgi:hypothetical protein